GRIQAGERVLILGASGGVGTGCVLLCKLAGAEVIACGGGEKKLRRLRELGADHVVDYTSEDFVAEVHWLYGKPARREYAGGVNVVINFTGGDTWAKSLRAIQRGGRMLTCGATAGYDPKTDLRYIWTFELEIKGSNGWTPDDLTALLALGAAGKLRPVVDTMLPLEEFQEAFRLMEQRELFGKVILTA